MCQRMSLGTWKQTMDDDDTHACISIDGGYWHGMMTAC